MIKNFKMKFPLSVSTTSYNGKCKDWGKVTFRTVEVDIDSLAEYVKQGFCFTHIFKGTVNKEFGTRQKTISNFDKTYTVFIDVDESPIPAPKFYESVSCPPSMLYTTPNNITGEVNRYRLVYLFESPITDNHNYKTLVNKIVDRIKCDIPDFNIDTTCMNCSQQMGGNSLNNCILYKNYSIYDYLDFIKEDYYPNKVSCIPRPYKKEGKNDIQQRIAEDEIVITNHEFLNDFWKIADYDSALSFILKYKNMYPIVDITPVDESQPFIRLNDNYTQIRRRTYITKDRYGNRRTLPVKVKQGNRERILFLNALLRLKIQPKMEFEQLLYALTYERQYWIDNTDRTITNHVLYKIAKGAFLKRHEYTPDPTYKNKNKSGYKVNPAYCKSKGVSPRSMANRIRTMVSDKILSANYDFTKSVAENSRILKDKGIKPNSERRLYTFLRNHKNEQKEHD